MSDRSRPTDGCASTGTVGVVFALAALVGPTPARAQPPMAPPPAEVTLPAPHVDLLAEGPKINAFQLRSAGRIELAVPGADDGTFVDLAAATVGATMFEAEKCRLTVRHEAVTLEPSNPDPRCTRLLASKISDRLVARVGSREITIGLAEPETIDAVIVQRKPVPSGPPGAPPMPPEIGPLPTNVARGTQYLFEDDRAGRWFESVETLDVDPQSGRIPAPPGLVALLQRQDLNQAPLQVLVHVHGPQGQTELRRLVIEARDAAPSPPSTPSYDLDVACQCELDRKRSIPDTDPHSACNPGYTSPTPAVAPTGAKASRRSQRQRRRARDRAVRKDWQYLVCVDFTEPQSPRVRVRTTEPGADPDAERGGRHLFAGRDLEVLVWRRQDVDVEVDLSGTAARRRIIAPVSDDKTESATTAASSKPIVGMPVRVPFAGRSHADDFVDLEITLTTMVGTTKTPVGHLVQPLSINEVYVGALRAAATASWAPWDRTWTTRPRSPTATNPGQEIVIDDGVGSGIAHLEFVAGYTAMWRPVYEHERTVSAGSFFGLGVLGTDPTKGIAAFTSVHFAPIELTIGRYFGVALDVSLRRTTRLRDGLAVGSPVADGAQITRFGVTPAFGIVFDLGPQFAKTVGLAHKGFAR